MDDNGKIKDFFKNIIDSERWLKTIPFWLFLICLLLSVSIYQNCKTNSYLKALAQECAISINGESDSNGKSSADIFFENKSDSDMENNPSVSENEKASIENKTEISTKTTDETIPPSKRPQQNNGNIQSPPPAPYSTQSNANGSAYVINKDSKKIHKASCSYAESMIEENKLSLKMTDTELNERLNNGYSLCKRCFG